MNEPAPFRYKPTVVQAIRYLPGENADCNCNAVGVFTGVDAVDCSDEDCSKWEWDVDWDLSASPGGWIVKIDDENFAVYSPEKFHELFEDAR
jgi:hypothetical protein